MKMSSWCYVLVSATAVSLIGYPKPASATTFDVTVGPNFELVFSPSSVTIHPGDQVRWTFASSGHSTTSGSPGQPNNIWDSGIRNQERPLLTPLVVPERFRTTALHTGDVAPW